MGDGKAKRPEPAKGKVANRARPTPQRPGPNNTILAIRALRERRARAARDIADAGFPDKGATLGKDGGRTAQQSLPQAGPTRQPDVQVSPHSLPPSGLQSIRTTADHGLRSTSSDYPHRSTIQRAFGDHDISDARSAIGGDVAHAAEAMNAGAFTVGNHVGFREAPTLRQAAHEAAHVVQQRGGLQLDGGFGKPGDRYEQNATAVADAVVRGASAEHLLDAIPQGTGAGTAVQCDPNPSITAQDATPNELRAGPVGPRLELSPEALELEVFVGLRAQQVVSIRNPDSERHVLDFVQPMLNDPFHQVTVAQSPESVMLAPGETWDLTIAYQPAYAGGAAQTFQIGTDGGAGPTATLEVNGTARNSTADESDRVGQQEAKLRDVDAARSGTDRLRAKRADAALAVKRWARSATAYEDAYTTWLTNNWIEFYGHTGGDVRVDKDSYIKALVIKVGPSLASKAVKAMIPEEAIPAGVAGTVTNFVLDKAIKNLTQKVLEGLLGKQDTDPDASALQATEHVSNEIEAKNRDLASARSGASTTIQDAASGAFLEIATATTEGQLDDWQQWARAQQSGLPAEPDPADRHLADILLETWVRERAATPTSASHDTNPVAWAKARARLTALGKLTTRDVPTLFVDQCRHEWDRLGFDPEEIDPAVASLYAQLQELGSNTEAIKYHFNRGLGVADFHWSSDVQRTYSEFKKSDDNLSRDQFARPFHVTCTLLLDSSGSSIYVYFFDYHLLLSYPDDPGKIESNDITRTP